MELLLQQRQLKKLRVEMSKNQWHACMHARVQTVRRNGETHKGILCSQTHSKRTG
jgi:hypothetical protein